MSIRSAKVKSTKDLNYQKLGRKYRNTFVTLYEWAILIDTRVIATFQKSIE